MRYLVFLLFLIVVNTYAQEEYLAGAIYKYYLADTAPDVSWNDPSFDDSNWQDGLYSISFGYGDDSTMVSHTNSFYLRYTFEASKDTINIMQLLADFDDGYIAYLNGHEIVRVNLGRTGTPITFDDSTERSREALSTNIWYTREYCNPSFAYYIDTTKVENYLNEGKNVLAIEVHNDSLNGSDLKFQCYLFDVTGSSYNVYSPFWKGFQQIDLDSTHLPIVKIETDEFRFKECKTWVNGYMQIIDNDSTAYNKPTDTVFNYNGYIGIKTKGQSSADWAKGNYNLETRNADGSNNNVKILGMPKENDWVLFGPFADRSLLRNELMFTISNNIGLYAPRSRFCELILNGDYLGVYQIIERIKKDDDRVDVKTLTQYDNSDLDVTGGYIFKFDKGSYNIQIVYPDKDDATFYQLEYLTNYFNEFKASVKEENLFDEEKGYKNYVDIPSYLDYTIMNELCKNPDAYLYSFFMYKDRDDVSKKIHFGPVWDYDLAFGNATFQGTWRMEGWQFEYDSNWKMYQKLIFQDSVLTDRFARRWKFLRTRDLHTDTIMALIDEKVAYLGDAITRNYTVWPVEGRYMNIFNYNFSQSYDEEITKLKSWISRRLSWIDANIESIYYPYTYQKPTSINEIDYQTNITIYPNPFYNDIILHYSLDKPSEVAITISDVQGQIVYQFKEYIDTEGYLYQSIPLKSLSKGIYFLSAKIGDKALYSEKLIKR